MTSGALPWRETLAVVDSERSAGRKIDDGVELPSVHEQVRELGSTLPVRQGIRSAKQKAVGCIEKRRPMLRIQIERVLGEIVFAGNQGGGRAGQVERGNIVETL